MLLLLLLCDSFMIDNTIFIMYMLLFILLILVGFLLDIIIILFLCNYDIIWCILLFISLLMLFYLF